MIETYGAWVDHIMQKWFTDHPSTVPAYAMTEYHLGWRDKNLKSSKAPQGKMLRPVLCLLSYQIFNESLEAVIPLAASIEFYHNHTLVLDDIQDGDDFRRGRPTVWSLWGIGQGINVGLLLGYLSHEFLLTLSHQNVSKETLVALEKTMNEAMIEVAEGQSLDLDFESRMSVEPSEYLTMIGKKTGALIGFSTYGGALLGSHDESIAMKFKNFGRKLGVAMQIKDDLVGIWGGSDQSGKDAAKDLRRRKKTFPFFQALKRLNGNDLILLKDYFRSSAEPDEATVNRLVELFETNGVREACEKEANELMKDVFLSLTSTGVSTDKLGMLELFSRHAFESIGTLRQPASRA